MSITYELIRSWNDTKGNVNSMDDIKKWIKERNSFANVSIQKVDFSYNGFWYYDEKDGRIRNENNSFFQLAGYQEIEDDHIVKEQPIIIQNEIGYLGIICKMINGKLNFLMQAKVEPGNINVIQISPTIQATKSNFSRAHGGKAPAYLEYFQNLKNSEIIVDQLQSEQSSRFYKKRNRNIVILVDEDIPVYDSHMWMTLGQIKECMKIKNCVNMDTRTVISCIPFAKAALEGSELDLAEKNFADKSLFNSMFKSVDRGELRRIFHVMNDYKMYRKENSRLVPIKSLRGWKMTPQEIVCKTPYDFKVIYCFIEINGREVKYWEQPLIEANGMAIFGIFTTVEDGVRKFLVRVKPEMGCFDGAELGPVVQLEPTNPQNELDHVEAIFLQKLEKEEGLIYNVVLSEEGGRFYHEQNQNVIIELQDINEIAEVPEGYFWIDYATINQMIQFNNCVNIQLRNLLSLLEI